MTVSTPPLDPPLDSPLTVTPAQEPSLAHPSVDPPSLVGRARAALGWQGSDFLVGLQGYDDLMATLDVASDVEGLVRIGDPTSPPLRLLRALGAASPDVRLVRVATLAPPWRWTRLGGGAGDAEAVALRQQTYSDVVGQLGHAGVTFRVLPDNTSTARILAVGTELGSAVVDVDELRGDDILITGFLEPGEPLTYGLLSRRADAAPSGEMPVVVWLTMAAEQEAAGTLMTALEHISGLGLDLDFLHSDPREPGRHDFHLGFRAPAETVPTLQRGLLGAGFRSRVLATFGLG